MSVSGSLSSLVNGHGPTTASTIRDGTPRGSRKLSLSKWPSTNDMDPDELFTKYTIAEVKFVQHQLRADADAKQEELRLMVGERYRDLLQASTSIISLGRSSKRVLTALDQSKTTIASQKVPPLPQKYILKGVQDTHLHTLQLLSAHIKVLLDAPEHLWRLIEHKKYFTAAWLYLLSRVVHRGLQQDEEMWSSQGINVPIQFPIIERQWEAVLQFSSQIVHKATISLREPSASSTDVCATVITLHLLEPRKLTETLTVFLSQRSRSLSALLSYGLEKSPMTPSTDALRRPLNGRAPEYSSIMDLKPTARQIKDATQNVLETIASTLKTSRDVFESGSSSSSLAESVLEYIQAESPQFASLSALPTELQLTTESLLMTLPSSTHFMLLPANLKSYKPYVDLGSLSSHVTSADLTREVSAWLSKATTNWRASMDRWFVDLSTVKEVWTTRHGLRKWIFTFDGFKDEETRCLCDIVDETCRQRISSIWKAMLLEAESHFYESIAESAASFRQQSLGVQIDALPMQNLFQKPSLPVISSVGPVDASFQKYKASLRRQLLGRTALLDEVLRTLESCARSLQNDISHVLSIEDAATNDIVHQLKAEYYPNASLLCVHVVENLENVVNSISDTSDSDVDRLVFVGRVIEELSSNSNFAKNLSVQVSVTKDFHTKLTVLWEKIIDRWRSHTVLQILSTHYDSSARSAVMSNESLTLSWNLSNSLLSLTYAVQRLGVAHESPRQTTVADLTLQLFITKLLDESRLPHSIQSLFEIEFLRKLVVAREGEQWQTVQTRLEKAVSDIRSKIPASVIPDEKNIESAATEHLARTQLLFSALTKQPSSSLSQEKLSGLLSLGVPIVDQREFQPVMEVVTINGSLPQRFNEILVASV